MIPFIDLKAQYKPIEKNIRKRLDAVLEHGRYILGPEIEELENELSQYLGVKHSIACSSGTDALVMALMALDIKEDDEVIVPDFSFFGTAEVIELVKGKVVFADIDPDTYNLDPKSFESKITSKTKAVMPVSLYGLCADYDQINSIAAKHNIAVIEDGAQSFGASYKNKKSLNLTSIGCTSFFPSKPLGAYGDAGAVFTNDDKLADELRKIRMHGENGRYNHERVGLNARIDSFQAGILIEKLAIFDKELELRQEVAHRYQEALSGVVKLQKIPSDYVSAYAQFTVAVENRDSFIQKMTEKSVPTAIHYPKPMSQQTFYNNKYEAQPLSLEASTKVVSLPFYPYLKVEDQLKVIEAVKQSI